MRILDQDYTACKFGPGQAQSIIKILHIHAICLTIQPCTSTFVSIIPILLFVVECYLGYTLKSVQCN